MKILMKCFIAALLSLGTLSGMAQEANKAVLTLVDEGTFNKMKVDLKVVLGNSTDTSTLTGTLDVQLNIDHLTGQTNELTVLSADVAGSDVTLAANGFLGRYRVDSSGLNMTIDTPNPPGVVVPETGNFEASQYHFLINEGTLDGDAVALGSPSEIHHDYSTDPFEGTGTGTGNVTVTPTVRAAGKQFYEVVVIIPLSIEETIEDIGGSGQNADAKMTGTVKAVGTTFVELPGYGDWAQVEGLAIDSRSDFTLSESIPNSVLYALGYDTATAPDILFSFHPEGVVLLKGAGVVQEDLVIQWSTDLENWTQIPQIEMVAGNSLIQEGTDLELDIVAGYGGLEKRYYRIVSSDAL